MALLRYSRNWVDVTWVRMRCRRRRRSQLDFREYCEDTPFSPRVVRMLSFASNLGSVVLSKYSPAYLLQVRQKRYAKRVVDRVHHFPQLHSRALP